MTTLLHLQPSLESFVAMLQVFNKMGGSKLATEKVLKTMEDASKRISNKPVCTANLSDGNTCLKELHYDAHEDVWKCPCGEEYVIAIDDDNVAEEMGKLKEER